MTTKTPWICSYFRTAVRHAIKAATSVAPRGKELVATFDKEKFKQALLDGGRHNRKLRKIIRGL